MCDNIWIRILKADLDLSGENSACGSGLATLFCLPAHCPERGSPCYHQPVEQLLCGCYSIYVKEVSASLNMLYFCWDIPLLLFLNFALLKLEEGPASVACLLLIILKCLNLLLSMGLTS